MKFLALDFGGTFVKHCILNENADIEKRGEVPAPLDSSDSFVKVITDLYAEYPDVDGIAISMPGVIDSENGIARSAGAYTATMGGKNIFELLKGKVNVPVSVENDGKAAILAEQWKGALKDVTDGAAVIVGSGLGGGIIMDGKLRKGGHFAAGEISGLLVSPGIYDMSNYAAACGSTSSLLLGVAMAKGMNPAQFEISGFVETGTPDPNLPVYSGKDVFKWIEDGDAVTCAVYDKWLKVLVQTVFNMKMTLDPQKIVIGGGISRNERFIRDLKAEYETACAGLAKFGMPASELDVCMYTSDANLVGAVYNWLLQYSE